VRQVLAGAEQLLAAGGGEAAGAAASAQQVGGAGSAAASLPGKVRDRSGNVEPVTRLDISC
jgi:hypothetical protein